ncbi:hypothetical protein FRC20_001646 [Serendipita sp. 405]|nr:hypothetical protein FRC20_001646 [Serendipita sp. 405]
MDGREVFDAVPVLVLAVALDSVAGREAGGGLLDLGAGFEAVEVTVFGFVADDELAAAAGFAVFIVFVSAGFDFEVPATAFSISKSGACAGIVSSPPLGGPLESAAIILLVSLDINSAAGCPSGGGGAGSSTGGGAACVCMAALQAGTSVPLVVGISDAFAKGDRGPLWILRADVLAPVYCGCNGRVAPKAP